MRRIWPNIVVVVGVLALVIPMSKPMQAQDVNVAANASLIFADNCFSPFLTAEGAEAAFSNLDSARVEFYDLDPLSEGTPSPVVGRPATAGTDRRCEVSFDGDFAELAASAALIGLNVEGLGEEAPLPDRYERTQGTELLAVRQLNPRRIAVVHVGTREGPNGTETFMLVERMTPLEPVQ